MPEIPVGTVQDTVKSLVLEASYCIGSDVLTALQQARDNEPSELGRSVLDMILENHRISCDKRSPICQGTGMALRPGSLEHCFSLDRTVAGLLTQEGIR